MRIFFLLSFLISFFSLSAFNRHQLKSTINLEEKNCTNKNLVLKTETIEKDRKFLFWKLRHKKIIVVDQIIDTNGHKILQKTSIYICSMDACDTIKFRRLKIIENEIWLFYHNKNLKKNIIKRFDFCGNYLGQKRWDENISFTDY